MSASLLSVDATPVGLTWVIDEPMRRASHAVVDDGGGVWLIDPVDIGDCIERACALGSPAGVLQLLDRHGRDNAALSERLGVPHLRLPDEVPGSPFSVVTVLDVPRWREKALWWPARRVLVVAETVGSGPWFRAGDVAAGIHLFLRLRPPGALKAFEPEHLLMGHGASIHGPEAAHALRQAYARSLRDLPGVALRVPFTMR